MCVKAAYVRSWPTAVVRCGAAIRQLLEDRVLACLDRERRGALPSVPGATSAGSASMYRLASSSVASGACTPPHAYRRSNLDGNSVVTSVSTFTPTTGSQGAERDHRPRVDGCCIPQVWRYATSMSTPAEIAARSRFLKRTMPVVVVVGPLLGIGISFFPITYAVLLIFVMLVAAVVAFFLGKRK
jgi:hypothetical protein